MSNKKNTFSISELAAQFNISPRTIRFYEEKNLISPKRTSGNQRMYSQKDRVRLRLILRGKGFGFSLDEIGEMIGMANVDMSEIDQIKTSLAYSKNKIKDIRERKAELTHLENELTYMMERLSDRLDFLINQKGDPPLKKSSFQPLKKEGEKIDV
ncbi:MAG: MerR family DNA-binding transcriptional regulator [Candidatus Magnetomorum sp.]|nr:MerR family DNA-binding transcriptional regulator [Candidatus Magnetomorum sp.]